RPASSWCHDPRIAYASTFVSPRATATTSVCPTNKGEGKERQMTNKWATYDALVAGRVPTISVLNEPVDYSVDFVIVGAGKEESGMDSAQRSWVMKEVGR